MLAIFHCLTSAASPGNVGFKSKEKNAYTHTHTNTRTKTQKSIKILLLQNQTGEENKLTIAHYSKTFESTKLRHNYNICNIKCQASSMEISVTFFLRELAGKEVMVRYISRSDFKKKR